MAGGPYLKITTDSETNQFRFQALAADGHSSNQYVPDLLRSPNLVYVFDDPQVLTKLVRGLSVKDQTGKTRATGTLALMRKMKLQMEDPTAIVESRTQRDNHQCSIDDWGSAIRQMPARHHVEEVQLGLKTGVASEESIEDFLGSVSTFLSRQAGRKVDCVVAG